MCHPFDEDPFIDSTNNMEMDNHELKRERKERKKRKREKKESTEVKRSKEVADDQLNDEKDKKKRKRDKEESNGGRSHEDREDKDVLNKIKSETKKQRRREREEGNTVEPNIPIDTQDQQVLPAKEKKDKKKKKRQREEEENGSKPVMNEHKVEVISTLRKNEKIDQPTKEKKRNKSKEKKDHTIITISNGVASSSLSSLECGQQDHRRPFPVDYQYIMAPMVGASELPFRLLCRKYGAQLCYTPMMSSTQFVHDAAYRQAEFLGQVTPEDRPLVCHFSANDPNDFSRAAQLVEPYCDAIDLNLGCPQRTAYVGHFGSYLLDPVDRALVLQIVAAGVKAVSIPICCKIRLLNTLEETIELCQQLREAGASLIAIHARYRASWERTGPGARDGPALLDQVTEIRKHVPDIPIIANGNTKTFDDVVKNLELTKADGLMSAEGILDDPALFLPRLGVKENEGDKMVTVMDPSAVTADFAPSNKTLSVPPKEPMAPSPPPNQPSESDLKKRKRLTKKLREIERIEEKVKVDGEGSINQEQKEKLATKSSVVKQLSERDHSPAKTGATDSVSPTHSSVLDCSRPVAIKAVPLRELYSVAEDKLSLANEYLSLVRRFPTKIRTVIFHTRRMLRSMLEQYQLLEDLLVATTVDEVQVTLNKCLQYRDNPQSFEYDRDKARRQKEALEKRRHEEGKRKAFEARMMRKAKREGKTDLSYYLRQGTQVPTAETVAKLKKMTKEEQLSQWKALDHSQHCLAFHLDPNGCKRDRACAFLHVETKGANAFEESDEVAG